MDYATLSKIKPDLIHASVTTYGPRGPEGNRGGFDYQGQGKSGLMFSMGEPGMPPVLAQFGVIDQATAIMASYQVVIAILMRDRYCIGQEVDVSLASMASYMMYLNNLTALLTGEEVPRHEQATADPMRNYYKCQDGKWVIHNQVARQGKCGTVCELLGIPELIEDPRYDTRVKRLERSEELVAIFNAAFLKRPRDEWVRLFAEKDLIMSPVNTTMEAVHDPQMAANDYIVDYEHPELGKIKIPGFPIHFSGAEINNNLLAPKLGEHTESVLTEIGGFSEKEITRLRDEGTI
jgi:crotonobetainyl-CoA:carnitine CoA-transferase CaiB-like acyl-CoA transferase